MAQKTTGVAGFEYLLSFSGSCLFFLQVYLWLYSGVGIRPVRCNEKTAVFSQSVVGIELASLRSN
jgi:hypothetical protein